MNTQIIPLVGDIKENLYQLGIKEAESFRALEERVTRLLSTNSFLRYGQDIVTRAKNLFKKKEHSLWEECIAAYSEGLGIDSSRYMSFIALFELAAHYGQVYPELKGLLPGCTSLFEKTQDGITHTRLIDFPLVGLFEEKARLYYWQIEGKPSLLNYSCEGLAPLFLQVLHENGTSLALHHKPSENYHKDGQSIFQITFEMMLEHGNFADFKRELRKRNSVTKWGYYLVEPKGQVQAIDIDGPNINFESFSLNDSPALIFTNIPLQKELAGFESFIHFCEDRQHWLQTKLKSKKNEHILDLITDVEDQKIKKWQHSTSTLSTVGAIHINLSKGHLDLKEGQAAMVRSDRILRFSLSDKNHSSVLKEAKQFTPFEEAWKRASKAQALFDQGHFDKAYHELQMAQALMPSSIWKEIFEFYLKVWDFRFVNNDKELAIIYTELKKITPPSRLKDQWLFLCMRLERSLNLVPTIDPTLIAPHLKNQFIKEMEAPQKVFEAWMKLLYPRLEILDIFSPHHK